MSKPPENFGRFEYAKYMVWKSLIEKGHINYETLKGYWDETNTWSPDAGIIFGYKALALCPVYHIKYLFSSLFRGYPKIRRDEHRMLLQEAQKTRAALAN